MGLTCSKHEQVIGDHHLMGENGANDVPDPVMYDFMKRSVQSTQQQHHHLPSSAAPIINAGQYHLLYKQQQQQHRKHHHHSSKSSSSSSSSSPSTSLNTTSAAASASAPSALVLEEEGIEIDTGFPTRMMVRRHAVRGCEEGVTGTHIYAIRWAGGSGNELLTVIDNGGDGDEPRQEQCPKTTLKLMQAAVAQQQQKSNSGAAAASAVVASRLGRQEDRIVVTTSTRTTTTTTTTTASSPPATARQVTSSSSLASKCTPILTAPDNSNSNQAMPVDHLFQHSTMASPPKRKVLDWVTVSEENNIYVADVGLSVAECDRIVAVTEHVCRGQYAAYTYAKQTLGCREFPALAVTVQEAVHTITHAILEFSQEQNNNSNNKNRLGDNNSNSNSNNISSQLALDDREPHMVKYDVTKKERQKLDMHTDKSEWTFLISLSNGCGMDYSGGGTYFECLDATVHIQRGHALVFPGKLRHCGQRITSGLRFLLVGFLVDKTPTTITKFNSSKTSEKEDQQQKQYVNNIS